MKAYLINLDRSPDRLLRMKAEFAKANINFERVTAVEGKLLSNAEVAGIKTNPGWKQPLNRTEIGCFLSHRKCLELIAQGTDKFAAVFEDDVRLSKDAHRFFISDAWVPANADVIKLETHERKVLMDETEVLVGERYSVARLRSQHILSAGYIISRRCAKDLLTRMNDAAAPVDHFFFTPACGFFNELVIYQVSPAICGQAGLASTLGADRSSEYQRPPVWRRIIRETKRPFQRLKTALWGAYINRFTKQKWAVVPPVSD